MRVAEKFVSINGEGTRAGELAVFIRFTGCNLNCGYCDTKWANEPDCPYEDLTIEEIEEYIRSTGIRNVTLTGGEPALQPALPALIERLMRRNAAESASAAEPLRVEIETNGAVSLAPLTDIHGLRPVFTMDYKLPGSGCEDRMITDNFALLRPEDTVKFVVSDRADLERAAEIDEEYGLRSRCHVYFSPVFGSIEPEEIVNFMIERRMNDARIQIQIHKVIWDPNRRGV